MAIYNDPAAEEWVRENIPNVREIKKFSGDAGWFEAVENGDAGALIYDYPFAITEIKEHPKTKIVRFNLNESEYAIGLPAKNHDLIDEINKAIESIMSSKIYHDLVDKYLGYKSDTSTMPSYEGEKTYVVKSGDTLGTIALSQLGSSKKWKELWNMNKERIPNPVIIRIGDILILP